MIPPSDLHSTPFLTHYFGGGLIDKGECYVVERYRSTSNGTIRRWLGKTPSDSKERSQPTPEVASVDEVRELRPLYNEIIVCTGLGSRSGVQYYGSQAIWGPMRRRRFPL